MRRREVEPPRVPGRLDTRIATGENLDESCNMLYGIESILDLPTYIFFRSMRFLVDRIGIHILIPEIVCPELEPAIVEQFVLLTDLSFYTDLVLESLETGAVGE